MIQVMTCKNHHLKNKLTISVLRPDYYITNQSSIFVMYFTIGIGMSSFLQVCYQPHLEEVDVLPFYFSILFPFIFANKRVD
jgi:hypothetical protein